MLVIGAAAILAAVVIAMAVIDLGREKQYVTQLLLEKGAALIKAFEAGTRTGMRGGFGANIRLQHLIEETANQPGIFYIAVTDTDGRILAHNNAARIGDQLFSPKAMRELAPDATEKWRLAKEDDGRESFLVYRRFIPSARGGGRGLHGFHGNHSSMHNPGFFCTDDCDVPGGRRDLRGMPLIIFVGLDVAPIEAARRVDLQNTLTTAGVLLVLGLGGVLALFWAQSYRAQRRALRQTTALASEVVAAMPAGLLLVAPDGRVAMANGAAESLAGVASGDLVGRPVGEVLPPDILENEEGGERQMDVIVGGGGPIALGVAVSAVRTEEGTPVGSLVVLRDLREMRRLEAEIRRREKLAAVGNLAAGVAHEIRNPLSSIRGYAAYFGAKFAPGSEDRQAAEVMVREVDRLNRVISELIEFARPSDIKRRPVRLSELASHAARLTLPDATARGVSVDIAGAVEGPEILADPDRLTQALLNLCLNAIQAMQAGGVMTLATGTAPDGRAFLSVADTGGGIDDMERDRIFDPYYTTKPHGTGLGLPIAHKIVAAHGGEIVLAARPEGGTVATVYLPSDFRRTKTEHHE
ncbi:PAS domain-containing sensor histidine kinase [Solidesulfovibrio fructosivorans]|uniref:PAS domain-containing sensor histidine kinase n=1 Tax=Solidesulfovibrio fructosivorans TaxID=878 RepID=UPI0002E35D90|nr:PAS domain-containing sensor histidine kinase [Solidesulfovibrio fructosivorans]